MLQLLRDDAVGKAACNAELPPAPQGSEEELRDWLEEIGAHGKLAWKEYIKATKPVLKRKAVLL